MKNLTKEDIEHLEFIYQRLAEKHGENKNVDYMIRFNDIIEKIYNQSVTTSIYWENRKFNLKL
jgi:hypothetical protein